MVVGRPPRPAVPAAFAAYAAAVTAAAVGALAAAGHLGASWDGAASHPSFWVVAGLVVAGEFLPIRISSRPGDAIHVSSAFALATLLLHGLPAAVAVYVAASVVADVAGRLSPAKVLFNAAQYALALAVAAAALALGGGASGVDAAAGDLPASLAAAAAFFLAGHVLAGIGVALLDGAPVGPYLGDHVGRAIWTDGFPLALAPVVVAAASVSLALVPLLFLPVVAIVAGGRQALANEHRARHDEVTGLPNRLVLEERLDAALADDGRARPNTSVVLVVLELDDFAAISDTLGADRGDALLAAASGRLAAALGGDALLARLGGDELALLAPRAGGVDDGRALSERAGAALRAPFDVEGATIEVTATMGVAVAAPGTARGEVVVRRADAALRQARRSGSSWEVHEAADDHGVDRLTLAVQLERAIAEGQLVVHYQPKLALRDGRPSGAEALVRWNHPQLGQLGPLGFVPLSEQTGLVRQLTAFVLAAAAQQARRWSDDGLDLRVSVNLSTRNLLDPDLPDVVARALVDSGLCPSRLQLEVTESRVVSDVPRARTVLEDVRALGVGVALDDFGTGYSSLAQLRELPVDEIKIDRSFVRDMEEDEDDAAIVRSTIDLGRSLGLAVTAEGVETEPVLRRLGELGCDFAQGYLLGRPGPADACRAGALAARRLAPVEDAGAAAGRRG